MMHILIVQSVFYSDIAQELLEGAGIALRNAGASFDTVTVPGAFEVPAAISMAAHTGQYDGYIALGCVIRGETTHYDYVCGESARGLNQLAVERNLAIGYGILTVENRDQAWVRARISEGNKGADAANACLTMVGLARRFGVRG